MFNQTGNDFVLQILSVRKSDFEVRKTLLLFEQQKRLVKILDYPFSSSEESATAQLCSLTKQHFVFFLHQFVSVNTQWFHCAMEHAGELAQYIQQLE